MKLPYLTLASALACLAPAVSGAGPVPAPDIEASRCSPLRRDYCAGTASNATLARTYVCGDPRLGPRVLPRGLPLGTELQSYDRFGGLCPGPFLAAWYNATAAGWNYPPQDGFSVADATGLPIEGNLTLGAGALLDRFGSEYGSFTSPAGAPYMQRALPPSNLDTPQSNPIYPYNYHVYRVLKPFAVLAGPIAPWFGQPGQGVQYKLSQNVLTLIQNGFLERTDPSAVLGRKK